MSKEMTAEEYYEQSQYKGERYGNSIEIDESDLTELMEAYANQKILEALEGFVEHCEYISYEYTPDNARGLRYYRFSNRSLEQFVKDNVTK